MYPFDLTHQHDSSLLKIIAALLTEKLYSDEWDNYASLDIYSQLLTKFKEKYDSPQLSWKTLGAYVANYAHPHDQQQLWRAPLLALCQDNHLDFHINNEATVTAFFSLCTLLHLRVEIYDIILDKNTIRDIKLKETHGLLENDIATVKMSLMEPYAIMLSENKEKAAHYLLLRSLTPCLQKLSATEIGQLFQKNSPHKDILLHQAICHNDHARAQKFIEQGHDIFAPNAQGMTSLHLVCAVGQVSTLQVMITR